MGATLGGRGDQREALETSFNFLVSSSLTRILVNLLFIIYPFVIELHWYIELKDIYIVSILKYQIFIIEESIWKEIIIVISQLTSCQMTMKEKQNHNPVVSKMLQNYLERCFDEDTTSLRHLERIRNVSTYLLLK